MQASSGEQPMDNNQAAANNDEEHDDEHALPDAALLQFQKQRSTPKVRISEMCVDTHEEVVHAEVDDFAQFEGSPLIVGMAKAGTEERVIRQLHKAGSIDASALLPDVQAAMQDTGAAQENNAAAQQEEEQKV